MGRIVIVTLSNKPELVQEAIRSVAEQTRSCVHIWAFDNYRSWSGCYPPAVFWNETIRDCAADDYLAWLSDDDYLYPRFAELLGGYLDEHPNCGACYGRAQQTLWDMNGNYRPYRSLPRKGLPIYDQSNNPLGELDQGQTMVRRSVLDKVEYPWTPEGINDHTRHCDGIFLSKLARVAPIMPATEEDAVLLRITPLSGHTRPDGYYDWRQTGQDGRQP